NINLPIYMLMFIAFLVGVIFTGLMGLAERLNLTRTIRQLNKTVRDLRRELRANEPLDGKEKAEKVEEADYIEP
ncbi:MAG: LapA family protein, partial [Syntrophales bacterium LBB04]|nr:LapA family protein [Syntrophales bacterium LBB04]